MLKIFTLLFLISSCSTAQKYLENPSVKHKGWKVIWSKNLDPEYESGNLPIALNSPNIHKGILYAGHAKGTMTAYDVENGREIWKVKDNGYYHGQPSFFNDQVIYGTVEGRVYSRHYLTGEIKYSIDLDTTIESPGVLHKGRLIFHARNHKIFTLDAETGKIMWAYKRSVPYLTTLQRVSTPLGYGDKIYVGFADGYITAFSLDEGILLWERRIVNGSKFVDIDTTPFILKNKLWVGSLSGGLAVLDLNTGTLLRRADFSLARKPLVKGNNVYLATTEGEIIVLDDSLRVLNRNKISQKPLSNIVNWQEDLAISSVYGKLYMLNEKSLEKKDEFSLGHSLSGVFGKLAVEDDKLAFISSRNRLYVLKKD